jgi:hypothetical protein
MMTSITGEGRLQKVPFLFVQFFVYMFGNVRGSAFEKVGLG